MEQTIKYGMVRCTCKGRTGELIACPLRPSEPTPHAALNSPRWPGHGHHLHKVDSNCPFEKPLLIDVVPAVASDLPVQAAPGRDPHLGKLGTQTVYGPVPTSGPLQNLSFPMEIHFRCCLLVACFLLPHCCRCSNVGRKRGDHLSDRAPWTLQNGTQGGQQARHAHMSLQLPVATPALCAHTALHPSLD